MTEQKQELILANELRIGNLLSSNYFDDRIVVLQVKEIRESQIIALNKENNTISPYLYDNEVKPIKLTEDILLKCGFEKRSDGHFNMFKQSEVDIIICNDFSSWKCDGINFSVNYIKHLHQLQNLFFSLCGEELEIKLQN